MKAFKGCTNLSCKAYKKIHYKANDNFCLKCGIQLSFVCADCWKPMAEGKNRYCISCAAEREQGRAEKMEAVKRVGAGAAGIGGAAVAIGNAIKNSEKMVKGIKKAVDTVADVAKNIKK